MIQALLPALPQAVQRALRAVDLGALEELRLRAGQVPTIMQRGIERPLPCSQPLQQQQLQQTLLALSAQSQYAVQEQLRAGFLTFPGGIRVGVCGNVVVQNGRVSGLREISSLALRFPRDVQHPPGLLLPHLRGSCLLAGAPGSGKTTLLRSCIRALSTAGARVGVVDVRTELAGMVGGTPQFDLGPRTDVLSGCPKGEGLMMLLRAMSPQWLAVDEITDPEDLAALRTVGACGVRLLASVHIGAPDELRRKPLLRALFRERLFTTVLFLDKERAFHAERIQYAEDDRTEYDFSRVECDGAAAGRDGKAAADTDACAHRRDLAPAARAAMQPDPAAAGVFAPFAQ